MRALTSRGDVRALGPMWGVEWGREKECFLNAYYMSGITLTLGINLGNNCCPSFTL